MPGWGCKCGVDENWACRVLCRGCGAAAPQSVREKAVAADKKAAASTGARAAVVAERPQRKPKDGPSQTVEVDFHALREEALEEAKAQLRDEEAKKVDSKVVEALEAKVKRIEACLQALGSNSESGLCQAIQKELDAARTELHAAWGPQRRSLRAERRLEESRAKASKLEAALAEAGETVAKRKAELEEAERHATETKATLAKVQAELAERQQELKKQQAAPVPPVGEAAGGDNKEKGDAAAGAGDAAMEVDAEDLAAELVLLAECESAEERKGMAARIATRRKAAALAKAGAGDEQAPVGQQKREVEELGAKMVEIRGWLVDHGSHAGALEALAEASEMADKAATRARLQPQQQQ